MAKQINEYYILRKNNGKYHAIDSHSFWDYETDANSAKKYYSFEDIIGDYQTYNADAIVRCTVIAEDVTLNEVNIKLRETALAKLTDEEKRVLGLR